MPIASSNTFIIFDCDGTLVDSETISMEVMVEFAAELGVFVEYQEAVDRFSGMDLKLVIAELETRIPGEVPEDFIPQFRTRQFQALSERLQPIAGAPELLATLDRPYCVASNAPLEKVRVCLETTRLDVHFADHQIFSAYQVNAWKPDPALFYAAARSVEANPLDCVVVEDSVFGIDAGIAAGMKVIAYDPHGKLDRQLVGPRSEVRPIRHLSEIPSLLGDA